MRLRMLSLLLPALLAGCSEESGPSQSDKEEMRSQIRTGGAEEMNQQGLIACRKEAYAKSIPLFQEAIRLQPDVGGYHNNLGRAFYWLGDTDQALLALREAARLDPKDPGIRANLGDVHRQRGRFEEAVRCYHEALELNPQFARAHCELGNLFLKQNEYDKAEYRLSRALQLDPGYDKALLARAIARHMQKRDALAWKDVEELDRRGLEVKADLRAAIREGMEKEGSAGQYRPGN